MLKYLRNSFTWVALCLAACTQTKAPISGSDYFARTDSAAVQTGGVKMITIHTPKGDFKVWTKRVGHNPRIKVLMLHGGPATTHEYFECFDSFMPQEGVEYYYYDQLGSFYSDQPKDTSLWKLDRFVDELEQVRVALKLDSSNFYLLGHSWGGILAMQYALKYQHHLKGLIISNMMASCPEYGKYADNVLAKQMNPEVLHEVKTIEDNKDFDNPRYMALLMPNFYAQHLCRLKDWPEPLTRSFSHINHVIYTQMQGPSEFGIGGNLATWDVKAALPRIKVPTLTIGATYDTMDPEHMKWMASQVQQGRFLLCPNGSHCDMWDDQQTWFRGVIGFIKDVDQGTFKKGD